MEDDFNGRQPQWKTNSTVNGISLRRPKRKQPQWKITSMDEDLNGRQTQW